MCIYMWLWLIYVRFLVPQCPGSCPLWGGATTVGPGDPLGPSLGLAEEGQKRSRDPEEADKADGDSGGHWMPSLSSPARPALAIPLCPCPCPCHIHYTPHSHSPY